jgi:hypothetical protein
VCAPSVWAKVPIPPFLWAKLPIPPGLENGHPKWAILPMLLFLCCLRVSITEKNRAEAKKSPYLAPSRAERRKKMMGQQQQTVTATTEERGGGTLFRRMILALAAAALMAAMMAMALSALPALAAAPHRTGPPLVECERLADIGSEFAPLAKLFSVRVEKIRLLTPEVDISEVMEGVSKVLDESISARKSASSCSDTPRNVFPCLIVL